MKKDKTRRRFFRLVSGREVFLVRLQMSSTYSGCLEGTLESNSRHIRHRLNTTVRETFAPNRAVVCIDPDGAALPDLLWMAEYESQKGVKTDDPYFNSRLCICWFSDTLPNDLRRFLHDALARIDWEQDAEDYDMMP
jgi:hypothetical protein